MDLVFVSLIKNIFLWLLFKNVAVVKCGFLHAFYS